MHLIFVFMRSKYIDMQNNYDSMQNKLHLKIFILHLIYNIISFMSTEILINVSC